MAKVPELLNANTKAVHVYAIGTAAYYPEGIVGRAGSLDHPIASARVGTHADDAAFTPGTDAVVAMAGFADETSPDSVDEGDVGAVRMTLDRILRVVAQQRAGTGAKTNVNDTATSTTILASNSLRKGASIWNDSTAILYLDLTGGTASATSCTVKMVADAYYEVPFGYTGLITGVWASDASGAARVTEWT